MFRIFGADGDGEIRLSFAADNNIFCQCPHCRAERTGGVAPRRIADIGHQIIGDLLCGDALGVMAQQKFQIGGQGFIFIAVPEETAETWNIQICSVVLQTAVYRAGDQRTMDTTVGATIGRPKTLETAKSRDLPCQTHSFSVIVPFGQPMAAPTVSGIIWRSPAL